MPATTPQTLPLAVALQQAIVHHQAGRLQEAEEIYRAILQSDPEQADANHNLGILARQVGQQSAGLSYLKTAVEINPAHEIYVHSYAAALFATGHASDALEVLQNASNLGQDSSAVQTLREQIEASFASLAKKPEAEKPDHQVQKKNKHASSKISAFKKAPPQTELNRLIALFNSGLYVELEIQTEALLARYPDSGFAWKVMGVSLQMQGKQALLALQKAARLLPNDAEAHNNLAVALRNSGQAENAVQSCRRALQIRPDYAEAHSNLGNALKDLGQLEPALASYTRALAIKPDLAETHRSIGDLLKQCGRFDEAASSYRRALELNPGLAEAHCNLGLVLTQLGQTENALTCYLRALEIQPDFAEAHINLGNALHDLGKLDQAVPHYLRALEINPSLSAAHFNLGIALMELKQLDRAIESYRRALDLQPDYVEAHNNLGIALSLHGDLDAAISSFQRSLQLRPEFTEAQNNLGNAWRELGQPEMAATSFRQALAITPDDAQLHNNLGNALTDLGQSQAALASYQRALELNPKLADAYSNLGNILKDQDQLADAVASYRQALALNPNFAQAHFNLGNALTDLGQLQQAATSYRQALAISPAFTDAQSALLFIHNYLADQTVASLLEQARDFGVSAAQRARPFTTWPNIPAAERCLRVGLVSADLRNHPVGYFVESMLKALSSNASGRIELFVYSNHLVSDPLSERIKACCHGWTSAVGVSDEKLAGKIHHDNIDILIDLSGHTAKNRLPMFAWKPAPVQVSWLGYFASTGLTAIDYWLADSWMAPASEAAHFVEKIQRLPETYLCFTPPDVEVPVSALPALTENRITFGCFNNLTKMNDAVVALWARVLKAVPDSRLLLKTRALNHAELRQEVLARFTGHGIDADRLILEGAAPRVELLAAYQRVDIALDPFPYPGGTTSVEALWMAVPVLTLAGERFLSHMGESILHNAGLPDWIARNPDDYVALAVSHSSNLSKLANLRAHLRAQVLSSPLFDAPRFARHFEEALRQIWKNWCAQQADGGIQTPGEIHET